MGIASRSAHGSPVGRPVLLSRICWRGSNEIIAAPRQDRCSRFSVRHPLRHSAALVTHSPRQRRDRPVAHGLLHRCLGGLRHRSGGGRYGHLLVDLRPGRDHGAVPARWLRHDDPGDPAGLAGQPFVPLARQADRAGRVPCTGAGRHQQRGETGAGRHAGDGAGGHAAADPAPASVVRAWLGRGRLERSVPFRIGVQQCRLLHPRRWPCALRHRWIHPAAGDERDHHWRYRLPRSQRPAPQVVGPAALVVAHQADAVGDGSAAGGRLHGSAAVRVVQSGYARSHGLGRQASFGSLRFGLGAYGRFQCARYRRADP